MHHIICDQWSVRLFCKELATLYDAFSQGRPSPLPDPLIQYAHFAAWERRSINSEFMLGQLSYWRRQLVPPLQDLDFSRNHDPEQKIRFQTARKPIELEADLIIAVKACARRHNCTVFMVLAAALSVVLFERTRQTDIRIGTLVTNRRRKETEFTFGNFVNTLILRISVSSRVTFSQLLRQVREVTLAAYSNQELPFEQVARVFEQEYKVERATLSQVLFMYQNMPKLRSESAGLTIAPVPTHHIGLYSETTITAFDLIFDLREWATKLVGTLTYKKSTLTGENSTDIVESFTGALGRMISRPEEPVC
jgi:NRPS condensation-like uncharacterized protein